MRLGVRGQLLLPVTVVVIGFVFVCVALAYEAVRRERGALNDRLNHIAKTLDSATFPLTPPVLEQMHGLTGADYFVHWSGQVYTTLSGNPHASDLSLLQSQSTSDDALGPRIDWAGASYYIRVRHQPPEHPNAGATLAILYPVGRWNATVAAAIRPVLVFGITSAIAVGLTLAVGGRLVAKVRALEAQTRKVAAGDFTPVPLPARDDELRDLAASINLMASQLQELQDSLRESERWRLLGQVSSGIGHQLRNGVAGAKLALQLHARESGEEQSEPLQVALRQLELIGEQVKRFLDLGKTPHPEIVPCSLTEVAEEAMALVRPRCRHLGIELRSPCADELPAVQADRGLLLQMILNLLGNAIEACGPGGIVEVRLLQDGGLVAAEVLDTGPGPSAAIEQQLFDPFVTAKPDGIGLGLTVVRRAAEAYGGRVTWQRSDGWTCFRVAIPALPTTPLVA